MKNKIYENVLIQDDITIDEPCIIGMPPRGKNPGEEILTIGKNAYIRSFSIIYAGSKIGDNLQTGLRVSIREDNIIGNNVKIGTSTILEWGNRIGNNVRIHSGCFLELACIEDGVFIGPGVIMTDDPHPPCDKYVSCKGGVLIKEQASVGGGAVLLPGIKIGKGAMVGAGSVVTKDVPDGLIVVGNPARVVKAVKDIKCDKGYFSRRYEILAKMAENK